MKIVITDNSQDDTYTARIFDGPDGIDHADFVCGSLGECFEKIIQFRIMNGLTYMDDDENPKEAIRSYFNSINQEEYTDEEIQEWTREDLLNAPMLSPEEIEELKKQKYELTEYAKKKLHQLLNRSKLNND